MIFHSSWLAAFWGFIEKWRAISQRFGMIRFNGRKSPQPRADMAA